MSLVMTPYTLATLIALELFISCFQIQLPWLAAFWCGLGVSESCFFGPFYQVDPVDYVRKNVWGQLKLAFYVWRHTEIQK
jgi:hypothetical protein